MNNSLKLPATDELRALLRPDMGMRCEREVRMLEHAIYWHHFATQKTAGRAKRPIGRWNAERHEDLAARWGVSCRTIRRALRRLQQNGWVETSRHRFIGRGVWTFLRLTPKTIDLLELEPAGSLVGRKVSVTTKAPKGTVRFSHPPEGNCPVRELNCPVREAELSGSFPYSESYSESYEEDVDAFQILNLKIEDRKLKATEIRNQALEQKAKTRNPEFLAELIRIADSRMSERSGISDTKLRASLWEVWKVSWVQSGNSRTVVRWRSKEYGQLNALVRNFGELDGVSIATQLSNALLHWGAFCEAVKRDRGYGEAPGLPTLGYLVTNLATLVDFRPLNRATGGQKFRKYEAADR